MVDDDASEVEAPLAAYEPDPLDGHEDDMLDDDEEEDDSEEDEFELERLQKSQSPDAGNSVFIAKCRIDSRRKSPTTHSQTCTISSSSVG